MKILAMTCNCVDVFCETGKILPGGNALNLAVNCKKAGAQDVYLIGNIGNDKYGDIIKQAIDKYKIDRSRVYEVSGQTANHVIHIDEKGDRYFKENAWVSGVWADYRISMEDKKFMQSTDIIATTLYEPIFEDIISIKRESGFLLSVDFHDEKINPDWEKYFDAIDLFFISSAEKPLEKLEEWSKRFNTIFTATLGARGSITFKNGIKHVCEAVKVNKVIDTTGCGDSYQGAFIVEYMRSKNIKKAMQKASESAAQTLSYTGGFEI
ncbi:MAG: PfkB family carbohydrate kinase [Endomicrobium sp.]|jgi:fructoselysine 6-kinase|nr:PfkB family carbohydrate kinase [Endomicrobium sp.]